MFGHSSSSMAAITNFDHQQQDWMIYRDRLQHWFIANDLNEEKDKAGVKRRAILLSALSEDTYKLASNLVLPQSLSSVSFDALLESLNKHFTPKRCGFAERNRFYAAVQLTSETHTQWAARLRGLAAHCDFKNLEDSLLDKFVMGMYHGAERDKLFSMDIKDLSLAKAVDIAESVRCARQGAAAAGPAGSGEVFKIVKSAATGDKCTVCGRNNHKANKCRFANYKCKKCNNKGHLRRMCKKVNYVQCQDQDQDQDSDYGDCDDDGMLFSIRCAGGAPMIEEINIGGQLIKFEVDSGSSVSAISQNTYNTYFPEVPLLPTKKRLITYTGDQISSVGIAQLQVKYSGKIETLDVYVVKEGGPPLLGRDFISKFDLELSPIEYCNKLSARNESQSIQQLLKQYPEVFTQKLGCFNKHKVTLQLKDNAKALFIKARPVAFSLREKLDKEIDRLLKDDVIEPVSHSEYASPIVPVLKRDGSVRLCADYSRTINQQLRIDQYPLPTVQELFSKLHGGEQYTKLDMSSAYNQLCLEDPDNITCINTHKGLFKYRRLVFGLSSAPAIFQKTIEVVLSGIEGVICFLDDVLITGKNQTEHLSRLKSVLDKFREAGLTLREDKCEFFQDEVTYLGHIINKHGIRKCNDKVKAILNAPVPTDVKQLQSFLGLVNYYRNFVPNASALLAPLYDLLKKGAKWDWSVERNQAFETIKKSLASDTVLAHFDPKAKIILSVDASPIGLAAILSQIGDDNIEKPISYASRTLTSAEKKYSQIQKEATAIIFGVKKYHQYLYARSEPFILKTDHKPLVSIFGKQKGIPEVSANRLQRYAIYLSAYNYVVEFVRSEHNSADFLSRAVGAAAGPRTLASQSSAAAAKATGQRETEPTVPQDKATYVNFITEGSLPVTVDELQKQTKNDSVLSKVLLYVQQGWPRKVEDSLQPYYKCRLQLAEENGCIMRGHKVLIPVTLQKKVLSEIHQSHLGIVKTKALARSKFWFPGLDNEIENMIGSCSVCLSLRPSPPRVPMSPWKFPDHPFYRLHLDFLGPLNNEMYLVIVDAYTKWVECINMHNNITSQAVISNLCNFFSNFGIPATIVSDNGTSFTSHQFSKFCELNGIEHITTAVYHPMSNGQAEVFVKILKKGIKAALITCQNSKEMHLKLQKYLLDYRNSINTTTGVSPAQLVFGRQLRSRIDLINPRRASQSPHTEMHNTVHAKQSSQCEYFGGKNRCNLGIGDLVLYKKYINKNKYTWSKANILKTIGKVILILEDYITKTELKRHRNQVIKASPEGSPQPTYDWDTIDVTPTSSAPPRGERENGVVAPAPVNSAEGDEQTPASSSEAPAEQVASATPRESAAAPPPSDVDDEASEAEAFEDADDAAEELNEPVQERPRVTRGGIKLRDIPRVDYKKYF